MSDGLEPVDRSALAGGSRGDRLMFRLLILLLTVASSLTPIRSYDYWWHLATGRLILERHAVPHADPFSFTAAGRPWIDHEWLFQVLAFLGHEALGPPLLVIVKALLIVGLCLLLLHYLKREGHGPAASGLILLPVLLGASFRLDVRPELATLLLAPLLLHLAVTARASGRKGPLLAIPALTALWANLHLGVVVAPAFLALGLAGTLISGWWSARRRSVEMTGTPQAAWTTIAGPFGRRLAATTVATALAVGINPYGLRIYGVPFALSRILIGLPSPNLEWARPTAAQFPIFWMALVLLLVLLVLGRRGIDPLTTPAVLLAAVLAMLHLRNIGLFCLVLPYGLARPALAAAGAARRRREVAGGERRAARAGGGIRPGFIVAAVLTAVGVPLLALLPPGVSWGAGLASDNEPRAAVDFLQREGVGKRLFNDVKFGGYLLWRRYPGRQVFIDGRNEVYAGLLHDLFAALKAPEAWRDLLDRRQIDAAFLRYPPTLQKVLYPGEEGGPPIASERAFSAAYFPRQDWALVYWDDDAMVFVRRAGEYADLIARLEYRAIHPDDWRHLYAGVLRGRLPVLPILDEIHRNLTQNPSCRRAHELAALFSGLVRAEERGAADPAPIAR